MYSTLGFAAILLIEFAAQTTMANSPVQVDAERQRIFGERAKVFGSSEKACYDRFAVSDCLSRVCVERHDVLSELRLQELVLNDLERQAKALAAIQHIPKNLADSP